METESDASREQPQVPERRQRRGRREPAWFRAGAPELPTPGRAPGRQGGGAREHAPVQRGQEQSRAHLRRRLRPRARARRIRGGGHAQRRRLRRRLRFAFGQGCAGGDPARLRAERVPINRQELHGRPVELRPRRRARQAGGVQSRDGGGGRRLRFAASARRRRKTRISRDALRAQGGGRGGQLRIRLDRGEAGGDAGGGVRRHGGRRGRRAHAPGRVGAGATDPSRENGTRPRDPRRTRRGDGSGDKRRDARGDVA